MHEDVISIKVLDFFRFVVIIMLLLIVIVVVLVGQDAYIYILAIHQLIL